MTPETKPKDTLLELILLIYRKRIKMLTIGIVIFLISFLVFKLFYIKYTSTVTFLIDNSNPSAIATSEAEEFALSQLNELSNNRMYLVLFSDEMARRLNENIKLGKHYGLHESDPDYISKTLSVMHSNIDIEKGNSNTVKITVKDDDKEFAADFANSLYTNLVEINNKIVRSNLDYKKETYRLNIDQLDTKNKEDVEKFLSELNKLQAANKSISEKTDELFLLRRDLLDLFAQYNLSSTELKKSALKYQVTSAALNDTTLQNLYLLNRAAPRDNTGAYVRASFWSLGIALACVFYYSLSLLFIQRIKTSFRELIKQNGHSYPHTVPSVGSKKNYIKAEEIKTS
jgi:capsular polysaccharide biosynthesis protein